MLLPTCQRSHKCENWLLSDLLASSKMSGSSLASFSLATSAIGPKITTGLRKPAVQQKDRNMIITQTSSCIESNHNPLFWSLQTVNITFPQHHPLIGRELGLNRLGREVLPALPQISLRTSQSSESPEVSSIAAWCFGESVLNTGKLLSSGQTRVKAESVLGSNYPNLLICNYYYGVII